MREEEECARNFRLLEWLVLFAWYMFTRIDVWYHNGRWCGNTHIHIHIHIRNDCNY